MSRINVLPNWMLPDSIPSVYDTQSGSFQEMVAKVYGAMRELQLDYKSFVNEINKSITEFTESTDQDQEKFKENIIKIIHDYIKMIDEKIKMQDLKIEKELAGAIEELLNELVKSGELENIITTYEYDSSKEMLTFKLGGAK